MAGLLVLFGATVPTEPVFEPLPADTGGKLRLVQTRNDMPLPSGNATTGWCMSKRQVS